jgi:hypothetical protein
MAFWCGSECTQPLGTVHRSWAMLPVGLCRDLVSLRCLHATRLQLDHGPEQNQSPYIVMSIGDGPRSLMVVPTSVLGFGIHRLWFCCRWGPAYYVWT